MATAAAYYPRRTVPWWVSLILASATLIVALLLLAAPGMTTVILVQVLGIYWLAAGIVHVASIFVDSRQWGWKLATGLLGVIAGLVTLQHPLWATVAFPVTLVFIIGMFGLVFGIVSLVSAFRGAGWGSGIIGALSVIFGLMLMFDPLGSAVTLPFLFGILGIVGGVVGIFLAFRDRAAQNR